MPSVKGPANRITELALQSQLQSQRRQPTAQRAPEFTLQGPALQAARRQTETAETVDPKTRQAAQDFEAFFIGHLLKDMRKSLPKGGLFAESGESRMMQDMLDETVADDLAHKGRGIGLAQVLMKQLQQSRS